MIKLLLILCCMINSCWADNHKIKTLDQQIKQLEKTLSSKKNKQKTLTQALKTSDLAIARLRRQSQIRLRHIRDQKIKLKSLQTKQARQQQQAAKLQKNLQYELLAIYRLGHQPALQQLLSQDDPNTLSQTMTYFQYLTKARQNKLNHILTELKTCDQTRADILKNTQKLTDLQKKLDKQQQALKQQRQLHARILSRVKQKISSQSEQLKQLREDKLALAKVLEQLKISSTKTTVKDKLPWPVLGKVDNLYGQAINQSELKHQGIVISAPAGTLVKAVAPGKVVFADWLRGFGLLIIIDHGNHTLSLYGRNQQLTKQLGETVNVGDGIAEVGQSGGASTEGLYFELRQHGKPINPLARLTPQQA